MVLVVGETSDGDSDGLMGVVYKFPVIFFFSRVEMFFNGDGRGGILLV
jgi:hypothetical protein